MLQLFASVPCAVTATHHAELSVGYKSFFFFFKALPNYWVCAWQLASGQWQLKAKKVKNTNGNSEIFGDMISFVDPLHLKLPSRLSLLFPHKVSATAIITHVSLAWTLLTILFEQGECLNKITTFLETSKIWYAQPLRDLHGPIFTGAARSVLSTARPVYHLNCWPDSARSSQTATELGPARSFCVQVYAKSRPTASAI